MGSFAGHVIPGTLFLLVGLWHMLRGTQSYLVDPASFRCRAWYPSGLPGQWKFLELWVILVGSFLDMLPVELGVGTGFHPLHNGTISAGSLNNYEHAGMLLIFFLFTTIVLISETTVCLPLPPSMPHALAACAFLAEFLLFFFHSTARGGVEARYHSLLCLIIGLCIALSVACIAYPQSYVADVSGSAAVALQGMWFYQTAFSLYGPLRPLGCAEAPDGIHCDSQASEMRGMAIASLQFTWLLAVTMILFTVMYGVCFAFVDVKLTPKDVADRDEKGRVGGQESDLLLAHGRHSLGIE